MEEEIEKFVENKKNVCQNCNKIFDKNGQEIDGSLYCEICFNNLFFRCENCAANSSVDEQYRVCEKRLTHGEVVNRTDDKIFVCLDCLERDYFSCSSCSKYFLSDNGYFCERSSNRFCVSCFESEYFICDECRLIVHIDNHSDNELCTNCSNNKSLSCIGDYGHYFPEEKVGKGPIFYGVELEVECDEFYVAHKIIKIFDKFVLLKKDGSLNHGFEIVTAPADMDIQKKNWEMFFSKNIEGIYSGLINDKCGMHVHCSRTPLTELTVSKILVFINAARNKSFIETIAERKSNHYSKIFPKKYSDIKNDIEKYNAVSLIHNETVEFRIFKGTLRKERFFKNLEFVEALIKFCWESSFSLEECQNYINFCKYVEKNRKSWLFLYKFLVDELYIIDKRKHKMKNEKTNEILADVGASRTFRSQEVEISNQESTVSL